MSLEKITSNNLTLREIKSKDMFAYSELFSDEETMELFGGTLVKNLLDVKNVVKNIQNDFIENKAIFWSITENEDREFIGFVRLMNYESDYFDISFEVMGDLKDSSEFNKYIGRKGWEIDYALLRDFRGKGIMTESLIAVLNFCENNKLLPLFAKVTSNLNKPTIKVLEKCGFKEHLPTQNPKEGGLGMIYKYRT